MADGCNYFGTGVCTCPQKTLHVAWRDLPWRIRLLFRIKTALEGLQRRIEARIEARRG